jgi:hypothetical protein
VGVIVSDGGVPVRVSVAVGETELVWVAVDVLVIVPLGVAESVHVGL